VNSIKSQGRHFETSNMFDGIVISYIKKQEVLYQTRSINKIAKYSKSILDKVGALIGIIIVLPHQDHFQNYSCSSQW
jgi:hypothetical protein